MLLEQEEFSALLSAAEGEELAAKKAHLFAGLLTDGTLAEGMARIAAEHISRHAALLSLLEEGV